MSHPSFLDFLVLDGCLKRISATDAIKDDEGYSRRVRTYVPKTVEASEMLMKVVGDSMLEVHDHQKWKFEEKPYWIEFEIRPTFLREFIRTKGDLVLEEVNSHVENSLLGSGPPGVVVTPDIPEVKESKDTNDADAKAKEETAKRESGKLSAHTAEMTKEEIQDKLEHLQVLDDTPAKQDADKDVKEKENDEDKAKEDKDITVVENNDDEEEDREESLQSERILHVINGCCTVNMFYVGYFLEQAVKHNMSRFYVTYPQHCANFKRYVVQKVRQRREEIATLRHKAVNVSESLEDLRAALHDGVDAEGHPIKTISRGTSLKRSSSLDDKSELHGMQSEKQQQHDHHQHKHKKPWEDDDDIEEGFLLSKQKKDCVTEKITVDGKTVELIYIPPRTFTEPVLYEGESFSDILDEFLGVGKKEYVTEGTQTDHEMLHEVSEAIGTDDLPQI